MRALFCELRRVLAPDGTLWLNIGDSYVSSPAGGTAGLIGRATAKAQMTAGRSVHDWGLPAKNLAGMPWRVAFALQADSWILRNDIVWHAANKMPESVTDRLSSRHEMVFLFSKSRTYWFDLDPIREPLAGEFLSSGARNPRYGRPGGLMPSEQHGDHGRAPSYRPSPSSAQKFGSINQSGRNPGDVWEISTRPFSAAHFAVMPPALAERCIKAGCKPGGTVLDPFSGSGTTGLAATRLGRRYVGIDLNVEYLDLSLETRLQQPGLDFGETA